MPPGGFKASPNAEMSAQLCMHHVMLPHPINRAGSCCCVGPRLLSELSLLASLQISDSLLLWAVGLKVLSMCEVDPQYLSFDLAWRRRGGKESLKSPPDRRQPAFVWEHGAETHVRGDRLTPGGWSCCDMHGGELSDRTLCDWWKAPAVWGTGWGRYTPPARQQRSGGFWHRQWFHDPFQRQMSWCICFTLSASSSTSSSTKVKDSQAAGEAWPGELCSLSKTRLSRESHQSRSAWSSVLSIDPSRIMDSRRHITRKDHLLWSFQIEWRRISLSLSNTKLLEGKIKALNVMKEVTFRVDQRDGFQACRLQQVV